MMRLLGILARLSLLGSTVYCMLIKGGKKRSFSNKETLTKGKQTAGTFVEKYEGKN